MDKEVAFRDNTISQEKDLPYPIVLYPGFYGSFLGFSRTHDSQIYFCSCAEIAINNYVSFKVKYNNNRHTEPDMTFILSKDKFPQQYIHQLIDSNTASDTNIINQVHFIDELCHECNKVTPEYSYCHSMYGGIFEQTYGWYINKQSLEYGVMPVSFKILEDVCPDEVFSLLDIGKDEFLNTYNKLSHTELLISLSQDKSFQKYTRRIRNIIENEVRVKFGFKKVGDAWASETLLFQLVTQILPDEKICRHFRADFLDNLELDVFIPSLSTGIEYQGIQHFEPVQHWGGEEALKKVKERDKKKKKLCEKHGIRLIYFDYTEELSKVLVERKLNMS